MFSKLLDVVLYLTYSSPPSLSLVLVSIFVASCFSCVVVLTVSLKDARVEENRLKNELRKSGIAPSRLINVNNHKILYITLCLPY